MSFVFNKLNFLIYFGVRRFIFRKIYLETFSIHKFDFFKKLKIHVICNINIKCMIEFCMKIKVSFKCCFIEEYDIMIR